MYVLIKIENHRDRIIDDVVGPFSTYESAYQKSIEFSKHNSSFNYLIYELNSI